MADLRLHLDGRDLVVQAEPWWTLAQALRQGAACLSVKVACGEGGCGACAVTVDGQVVHACLYPALRADGARIETAAGLADGPVGRSLTERGAPQCGFCIPGFVVAGTALVRDRGAALTVDEARAALRGNLCRCTGYVSIIDAIVAAAAQDGAADTGGQGP